MIDPQRRWAAHGEKPEFAGLPSFAGLPYTEDPADLAGADVVIVGAPVDELVSDGPGARFGPRAIRAAGGTGGRHLEVGVDPFAVLRILDYGDAAILPADPVASHRAIEATVGEVLTAGAVPVVLGGDHSIAEPDIRAVARAHGGAVGLIHFDTHTDTAGTIFGARHSHGTPMYHLVEDGWVDPGRYVQIGLRGSWPEADVLAWQAERGITSIFMHDVRRDGIAAALERAVAVCGDGPVFVTIDVDVLDPAFAPGTGTPEPGGMTSADLLWAAREVARRTRVAGADVVEVAPQQIGSRDITALVADRIVRELLTGLAQRRLEHLAVGDLGRPLDPGGSAHHDVLAEADVALDRQALRADQ